MRNGENGGESKGGGADSKSLSFPEPLCFWRSRHKSLGRKHGMVVSDFIEKARKLYPGKEAVICGNQRVTYEESYRRSKKLAGFFQEKGIERGDVVSILHYNCHYFFEAYYATAFCGAILNPINVRLSPNEILYILKDAESKLLITNQQYSVHLERINAPVPAIVWTGNDVPKSFGGIGYETIISSLPRGAGFKQLPIDEHDVAHLYYTSGTTGKPKGVPLSHKNVTTHALCAIGELTIADTDNWLHAAPLFHLADAWATFAFTAAGATHTMVKDFRPKDVFALIEKEGVTISNMIPSMLNMLINAKDMSAYDLSSLRLLLSGGAPIAPELVKKIIEKFNCDYMQTYGMTETSPYLTISKLKGHLETLPYHEQLYYKAKTGREFLGVSVRVVREDGSDIEPNGVEVGEIIVKGDIVTDGYWKLPEETAKTIKEGWLYTEDLATIDREGYVNIVDRKKDMIITGGENVYSTEVEYVLYEHPAVLEAAVIGVPDETWGEAVKAFVVLKEGERASEEEIISFVKEKIARFKAPKSVAFLSSLPKTGSGKITKKPLRERYGAR